MPPGTVTIGPNASEDGANLGPGGLDYRKSGSLWMIARIFRMAMLKGEESGKSVGVSDTIPNMDQLEVRQKQAKEKSGMHYLNFWMIEGCLYLDQSLSGFQGASQYLDSVLAHLTPKLDSMIETGENQAQVDEMEQEFTIFHILRIVILATVQSIDELTEWGARSMSRGPSYPVISSIAVSLFHVGVGLLERSLGEGGPDADMAIECHIRAIQLIPESDPILPSLQRSLGTAYYYPASAGHPPAESVHTDYMRAIQCYRDAAFLTSPQHDEFSDTLKGLRKLIQKFTHETNRLEDIDFAIECASQIIKFIPKGYPLLPRWFDILAGFYHRKLELFSNPDDADRAIELLNTAISSQPGDPELLFDLYLHLGTVHERRHQCLGQAQDLVVAIEHYQNSLLLVPGNSSPTGSHSMGSLLTVIGGAYWKKFTQVGELGDLDVAMAYHYQAISQTPDGHPRLAKNFTSIGAIYAKRYECLGDPEDIAKALEWVHQALRVAPEEPDALTHLGSYYVQRFKILGRLGDIDDSINYLGKALDLSLEEPFRIMALNNVGEAHHSRYKRFGNLEDLDRAMHYFTMAKTHAEASKEPSISIPGILGNLGMVHVERYKIFEKQEDINKAIQEMKLAESLNLQDSRVVPSLRINLGNALMSRHYKLNEDCDINEAIRLFTEGLAQIPPESPSRSMMLSNLGAVYLHRSRKQLNHEDIKAAVSFLSQASSSLPSEHPDTARVLNILGKAYRAQFEYSGETPYLHSASDHFRRAAQHSAGRPIIRFKAAIGWAGVASRYSPSEHLQAYQIGMDLVPQLIWLGLSINQRYSQEAMCLVGDVTLEAAAVAIQFGKYETALEWLEQGRSVVWGQTLQLRTPLDELAVADASLAENLMHVARELHEIQAMGVDTSNPPIMADSYKSPEMASQRQRYLAQEFEEIVGKIRQKPEFENFLQPKRAAELMRIPERGPVVVVNTHKLRCDALIVIPGKQMITHVALPNFSSQKAAACRARIESEHMIIRDRGVKKIGPFHGEKNGFQKILLELWEGIVKPVLDCLGYTASHASTDDLPHLTWCTTGTLSFLPLHAAGRYDQPGARVFDYAISSYTPTLTALVAKSPLSISQNPRLLLVGQECTPGHNPLPGTRDELSRIRKYAQLQLSYTQLEGSNATTDAVLNAMGEHEWIHLACHAHQNIRSPLDSGFFLHDGTLSLLRISRKQFKGKGLAFLSACQTAKGDKELSEEAVHLASGMLMAGYPAVIATMWSVADEDAPLVADMVYAQLVGKGQAHHQDAAKALHVAVSKLREKVGMDAFARWVPYIHIGN
ncbi:unnamed protein product [Rhizoctonia solani]|uniref:CHAT domain-containing protein n=1 Tax=Rhizoctonia solani TaxID=456999 RepID=A0A8H3HWA5_9AGAM|nr:unnamed protein product [Rhizoctonia solani]